MSRLIAGHSGVEHWAGGQSAAGRSDTDYSGTDYVAGGQAAVDRLTVGREGAEHLATDRSAASQSIGDHPVVQPLGLGAPVQRQVVQSGQSGTPVVQRRLGLGAPIDPAIGRPSLQDSTGPLVPAPHEDLQVVPVSRAADPTPAPSDVPTLQDSPSQLAPAPHKDLPVSRAVDPTDVPTLQDSPSLLTSAPHEDLQVVPVSRAADPTPAPSDVPTLGTPMIPRQYPTRPDPPAVQRAPDLPTAAPPTAVQHVARRPVDLVPAVQRVDDPPAPPPEPEPAPTPEAAPPPVVQAPAPAAVSTAAPASGAPPETVAEELVRKLFDPLLRRLKTELRLDRERRGRVTDRWR
ncbi:hypothetical protein [Actinokineospora terrae]|uniref:Syndecan 1 n=1 Tax=Actinokineospora terrae TaxID=155974 RepID=A0A1H9KNQ2_9PSEU|nr:hypothetical protein [Actinokineospora terrae]SER00780.1 hypothetical protein SAMN04487818_101261 [Actinokineospora terrae]